MDFWETLLHPGVWGLLLLFSGLLGAVYWLGEQLDDALSGVPVTHALFVWLGKPLLRVLPMLLFLCFSYPTLFGWQASELPAPASDSSQHNSALLNGLFLMSLILPQVPVLSRLHGPVLLLQLGLASALLFRWQSQSLGVAETISFIPPVSDGLLIVVLSFTMHGAGYLAAQSVGRWVEHHRQRLHANVLAEEMLGVLLQSPSLVLYTLFLGGQIDWTMR